MVRKIRLESGEFSKLRDLVTGSCVVRGNEEVFYDKKNPESVKDKRTDWILDFRRLFLDSESAVFISELFWNAYSDVGEIQIATVELGSVPLSWAILAVGASRGKKTNALVVRKSRKKDGLANLIEGVPKSGVPTVLIDDLANSGDSLLKALEILTEAGIEVAGVFCMAQFANPDFLGNYSARPGAPDFSYLLDLSDLWLSVAARKTLPVPIFPKKAKFFGTAAFHKTLVVPKSSPCVSEGKAYFSGEHGEVKCMDVSTWAFLWSFKVPDFPSRKWVLSSLVETPESVVFWAYDGCLYCLSKSDGAVRFATQLADWIGSTPAFDSDEGAFYVGLENYGEYAGAIAKVDARWTPVWYFPVRDFVHSSPIAVPGGGVVCGTNGGELIRLSSDGTELWCSEYRAPIKAGFCYVPETRSVCFGCHDGNFRCVRADDGAELWKVETPYVVYSTPAYYRGGVFFWGADGAFRHLDAKTWETLFSYRTGGRIFSQPSLLDEKTVVFGCNDMRVYFYDLEKRTVAAYVQHHERITTKPAFSGRFMILEDFADSVYRYDLSDVARTPRNDDFQ